MPEIISTDCGSTPLLGNLPEAQISTLTRLATPSDIPALIALIESLNASREHASKNGFLRLRHSTEDYYRYVENGHLNLALMHDQPVAFLLTFHWNSPELSLERESLLTVTWSGESYADPAHPVFRNATYIGEVGVAPQLARRGIGRLLYDSLINDDPQATLFAATIEKPIFNHAAAAFHQALGFIRIGTYETSEFFGLSPYQSGVYMRPGKSPQEQNEAR